MTDFLCGNDLWRQVNTVTMSALACGALKSIPTECKTQPAPIHALSVDRSPSPEQQINFQIREVTNLERKSKDIQQRANPPPLQTSTDKKRFNPFLPYDPQLYVGELTPYYRCLLNKFNVMDHHILMVTTQFEPQQTPLSTEDFLAAQLCLQAKDGLVFYNCGQAAGASVEHKHLQMIPLPLSTETVFPFHQLLLKTATDSRPRTSSLPFAHRVITTDFRDTTVLNEQKCAAKNNCRNYYRLLDELKLSTSNDGMMTAHNMLMTRDYLWVIPRNKESHQGLAVNALGFAGTLLVKNQTQCQQLEQMGCMELLKAVSF